MDNFIAQMIGGKGGNATEYCDVVFGTVMSVGPLEIQYDPQKPNLPEALLDLSQNVQQYELKVTFEGVPVTTTDGNGTAYAERHKIIIDNRLKVGDKVTMIRRDGGKRFYVLEKRATV